MKPILTLICVVGVGGLAIVAANSFGNTVEVENVKEPVADHATTTVEVEVDSLQAAQSQLEEANRILDEEETKLLQEKQKLEEQHQLRIDEIEARLEQVRETRTSF